MVKRILLAALLAVAPAFAVPDTTTISGTIYLPGGATPATAGSISAALSASASADDGGTPAVVAGRVSATITPRHCSVTTATLCSADGDCPGGETCINVTIALVPNDAMTPTGTYYTVSYSVTSPTAAQWTEKWTITTAPDPISIGSVTRVDTPPGMAAPVSTIMDEGTALTKRTRLNFTGSGVACADNSGQSRTDCTVTGGGGTASDVAYDAGTWDANTDAATKNAIRDKIETLAPLASPALTGVPTVPTAAAGTNTTQAASTAFVQQGFLSLDTTAQSMGGSKTFTAPAAGTTWTFNTVGAVPRLKIGPFTGVGSRILEVSDTSGVARSYFNTNGSLSVYDFGSTTTSAALNASSTVSWLNPQTFTNGLAISGVTPTSSKGFTFNTEAPTFNAGATFNTVAPTFSNVKPTFATTADDAGQWFEWPITNPATMKIRAGAWSNTFVSTLDNIYGIYYNVNPVTGARDDTGQHAFAIQNEFDYFDGTYHNVEHIYSFTNAAGVSWRPLLFEINAATEAAKWTLKANNSNSGNNRAMEIQWPTVYFGRDTGADVYAADAASGTYMYLKDFTGSAGGAVYGTKNKIMFDQSVSFTNSNINGHEMIFDFCAAATAGGSCATGKVTGYATAYDILTPTAPGAGSTVQGVIGWRAQDLRFDRYSSTSGYSEVFRADSQTCGSTGDRGNMVMAGTGYNHGHYQIGDTHFWEETPGIIAVENGAPTSDADGARLVINKRSTTSGPAAWAQGGVSCDTACTNIGQANCADYVNLDGTNGTGADCSTSTGLRLCECY